MSRTFLGDRREYVKVPPVRPRQTDQGDAAQGGRSRNIDVGVVQ